MMTGKRQLTGLGLTAITLAGGLIAMIAAGSAWAADTPTVDEIVNHTNLMSYFQGRDGRARVEMTITDANGHTRARQFTLLRRDEPPTDALKGNAYRGEHKYYVYFHRPADVSRMVLMVWKHQNRDDDRWLYLPALDLVKRIAASDTRTSFAGSDFFYEDVSGRSIDLDTHELVKTTDSYYVLRNRPKAPETVEFSYYDMYVHKATFLPIETDYFDRDGTKYRVYKVLKVEVIQGYPTATKAEMRDLKKGTVTTLSYSDVRYDVGLPDDIFTERYLRRAPRKYLR